MVAPVVVGEGRHRLQARGAPLNGRDGVAPGPVQRRVGHAEGAGVRGGGTIAGVVQAASAAVVDDLHQEGGVADFLGVRVRELHVKATPRVGHNLAIATRRAVQLHLGAVARTD